MKRRHYCLLVAVMLSSCWTLAVQGAATFDPDSNQVWIVGGENTLESVAQDLADNPGLFTYDSATQTAEFTGHYLTFGSAGVETHFSMTLGQTLALTNTAVNERRIIMNSGMKWNLHDCAISGFVQVDMNSGDQSGDWINVNWIRTNEPSNSQFTPFRIRTNDATWEDADPLVWRGGVIDTGMAFNTFIPDSPSSAYPDEPGFRRLDISDAEIISRMANVSIVNYYQSMGTSDPDEVQFNFSNCVFTMMNFDGGVGFYFQSQMSASPATYNFVNVAWRRDGEGVPAGTYVFDGTAEGRGLGMLHLRVMGDEDSKITVWRYLDVQTVARDGASPLNGIQVNAEAKVLNPEEDVLFLPFEVENVPATTGTVAGLGAGHTPLPPNSILVPDSIIEAQGTMDVYRVKLLVDVTAEPGGEVLNINPDQSWFRSDPMVPAGPDSITLVLDVEPPAPVGEWSLY